MKEVVRWAGSGGGQQRKGDQESIGEGPEEGPRRSGVGRPWAETELRARRDAGPCCCQSASPGWIHTARPARQHKQGDPPCHASLRHRVTTNAGNVTAATQPCRSRWTTRQGSLSLLFFPVRSTAVYLGHDIDAASQRARQGRGGIKAGAKSCRVWVGGQDCSGAPEQKSHRRRLLMWLAGCHHTRTYTLSFSPLPGPSRRRRMAWQRGGEAGRNICCNTERLLTSSSLPKGPSESAAERLDGITAGQKPNHLKLVTHSTGPYCTADLGTSSCPPSDHTESLGQEAWESHMQPAWPGFRKELNRRRSATE
jgi:hypothetical protein